MPPYEPMRGLTELSQTSILPCQVYLIPSHKSKACHRALCITEIQHMIVGHLFTEDCVALALVCRLLHEAALDRIWATLPTLNPLWRLWPDTAAFVDVNNRLIIRQDIDNAQSWARWNFYSSRILRISAARIPRTDAISIALLAPAISLYSKERRLLPRLQSLLSTIWTDDPLSTVLHDLLLQGPAIDHVSLTIRPGRQERQQHQTSRHDSDAIAERILPTLARLRSHIRSLGLTVHAPYQLQAVIAAIVPRFYGLKDLTLSRGTPSVQLLESLQRLPLLESLTLGESWTFDPLPSTTFVPPFPRLHTLRAPAEIASYLLLRCRDQSMRQVAIGQQENITDATFQAIVCQLLRSSSTLMSFQCKVSSRAPSSARDPRLLIPLSQCQAMEIVRLMGFYPPTNRDIGRLSREWTQLQVLTWLAPTSRSQDGPPPETLRPDDQRPLATPDAVSYLVGRCQSLRILCLPVDARSGPVDDPVRALPQSAVVDVSQWLVQEDGQDDLFNFVQHITSPSSIVGWDVYKGSASFENHYRVWKEVMDRCRRVDIQ